MDNNILSALKAIDVATLSRADWIAVGMALKEEGYPCSIWDDWSRKRQTLSSRRVRTQVNSFHGSGTPVKGGTIVQMAKERGWTPFSGEDDASIGMTPSNMTVLDGFKRIHGSRLVEPFRRPHHLPRTAL